VVGWIGVHPDAASPELTALWHLEERTRALGVPVLALRLGPLVGATSPLWQQLAATRPAGKLARKLVHPVLESDVVTTLGRALVGAIAWDGWFELGGREVFAVGELAELARAARPGLSPASGGGWEPGRDALLGQRLIEPDVWVRWGGIEPGSVRAEAARWAA